VAVISPNIDPTQALAWLCCQSMLQEAAVFATTEQPALMNKISNHYAVHSQQLICAGKRKRISCRHAAEQASKPTCSHNPQPVKATCRHHNNHMLPMAAPGVCQQLNHNICHAGNLLLIGCSICPCRQPTCMPCQSPNYANNQPSNVVLSVYFPPVLLLNTADVQLLPLQPHCHSDKIEHRQ
jgi:hypothetical protein